MTKYLVLFAGILLKGLLLYVPTSKEILYFINRWYIDAAVHSLQNKINEGYSIRIFSAPYFFSRQSSNF